MGIEKEEEIEEEDEGKPDEANLEVGKYFAVFCDVQGYLERIIDVIKQLRCTFK